MNDRERQVKKAAKLADKISRACDGEENFPFLIALSMLIGGVAAMADEPDFEASMKFVKAIAFEEFKRDTA